MSPTILLFLAQDGVMNGAVYALLGVTLVLMFTVTRVIFVAQGEFVAWGALTMAALQNGALPGTAKLLVGLGVAAAVVEVLRARGRLPGAPARPDRRSRRRHAHRPARARRGARADEARHGGRRRSSPWR